MFNLKENITIFKRNPIIKLYNHKYKTNND